MKVGIITNLYPPYSRGGAENVIVRTVNQFIAMGHDVFVITGQPKSAGAAVRLERSTTERIYRFFPPNVYFTLDDYKYPWIVRLFWHVIDAFSPVPGRTVGAILDDEKPDVVFTHNLKGLGLAIPRAIQSRGIPHLHVMHDLQLIIPSGLLLAGHEDILTWAKPFYAVYRSVCRNRFGAPDAIISPSQFIINQYMQYGFFKGVPYILQPNPTPPHRAIAEHVRNRGDIKLLFVGQMSSHKGVEFLLDAFERLTIPAELLVVGEGPLGEEVRERVKDNPRVNYLGYMPAEELMKCYGVADALVVPSLCYENSPTVIYEALNAGVPVIASRIGGVGELIREGETGYLFTPGVVDDFLRVVKELDSHRAWFDDNRERIRASVAQFSLGKYAERLVALAVEIQDARYKTQAGG